MTREGIMQKQIEVHQKYLKWLKEYYMLNPHIDFESELTILNIQLKECKDKTLRDELIKFQIWCERTDGVPEDINFCIAVVDKYLKTK